MTFYCGNAYETGLARIDRSSMPFGTRRQRDSFELASIIRNTPVVQCDDPPMFCVRSFENRTGKYIYASECTQCGYDECKRITKKGAKQ
jgi:hypothetical protein